MTLNYIDNTESPVKLNASETESIAIKKDNFEEVIENTSRKAIEAFTVIVPTINITDKINDYVPKFVETLKNNESSEQIDVSKKIDNFATVEKVIENTSPKSPVKLNPSEIESITIKNDKFATFEEVIEFTSPKAIDDLTVVVPKTKIPDKISDNVPKFVEILKNNKSDESDSQVIEKMLSNQTAIEISTNMPEDIDLEMKDTTTKQDYETLPNETSNFLNVTINLHQDKNGKMTQSIDPLKIVVICCSISLAMVMTLFVGLMMFCCQNNKTEKEDVIQMHRIENGDTSDTTLE